jgi:hypothetical protein
VAGGEPAQQVGVAGGVGPELDDQREPGRLLLEQVQAEPGDPLGAGGEGLAGGADPRDAALDRLDVLVQDGQEQVGLAGEARVDRPDGEAGVLGDLVQGGGVEAVAQEAAAGRGEQPGTGVGALLGAGPVRRRPPRASRADGHAVASQAAPAGGRPLVDVVDQVGHRVDDP